MYVQKYVFYCYVVTIFPYWALFAFLRGYLEYINTHAHMYKAVKKSYKNVLLKSMYIFWQNKIEEFTTLQKT